MELVRRVQSMREVAQRCRARGERIGLVPTMGALHEGHMRLVRRTRELCDKVVVSIFVNPTQFGPGEDLARYPRDLAGDVDRCVEEDADYVFAPEAAEIYPAGSQTFVDVTELSKGFESDFRPGHFRGVATVVLKLFQATLPHVATFGRKDAQQLAVVQRMVRDLLLDIEILPIPIVRDEDGLALSSRNRYLSAEQRKQALAIPRALTAASEAAASGKLQASELLQVARRVIDESKALTLEYLELVDCESFEAIKRLDGEGLLLVAARIGGTRLLDNVRLVG